MSTNLLLIIIAATGVCFGLYGFLYLQANMNSKLERHGLFIRNIQNYMLKKAEEIALVHHNKSDIEILQAKQAELERQIQQMKKLIAEMDAAI